MIRIVSVASLTALLLLVLYLPSAQPPERFMQQLRAEHLRAADFWGTGPAERMLDRMMALQADAAAMSPVPRASSAAPVGGLDRAVGQEMAQVNRRLFDNAYFRSIDALLILASYRLSMLLEWLPRCWMLALALVTDAFLERATKSKVFRQHDPEMFALYVSAAIFTLCASVLAMVWPWALHPAAWAAAPILVCVLASRAISHFHRRP
ncbi:hypothetical protein DelCs14_1703 [Delftia sp. Cs1-4]|uniref:DUF4400 domain-containing protein n=1 Tax=Delftia sp. (strain Cs1-4) TaxID=742013 RepID=UPI00020E7A78|nr:DUF4400 domain-containing protein [Delftia sp. Cs1-4]AEF88732.1 hypothetical protein DelCs14_1703 [Delftia sp. Cs1-4]